MSITMTGIEKTLEVKTTPETHDHEEGSGYGKGFDGAENVTSAISSNFVGSMIDPIALDPTIINNIRTLVVGYDFIKNAQDADKNTIDSKIQDDIDTIKGNCEALNRYIDILMLPTTEENNPDNKKKFLSQISNVLAQLNVIIGFFDYIIQKKSSFNGKEFTFDSPEFDYLKQTLKKLKGFDALYGINHKNTFLTRGISTYNQLCLGLNPWEQETIVTE